MLLEKIKQHAGKFAFFFINLLVVAAGALYLKQKSLEDSIKKAIDQNLTDAANSSQIGQDMQQQAVSDAKAKKDSIGSNSGTVTRQQTSTVTKTVPAVTQTVTTTVPAASSTKTSTSKATTKKS